jgi:hypothetical protein
MTTLLKPGGSYTTNLNETVQTMLDYLITRDDKSDDTDYHKRIRTQTEEPGQSADDRDFTPTEVTNTIEDLKNKKAPGEDGITGAIYQRVYRLFQSLMYTLYGECLRKGCFPRKWKKAKIIPVITPGKEKVQDASKFRPISLINVGGKVLEKLVINRIMYHIYSNNLLNDNQYGFTPKKSTTDATIAVKDYIEDGFRHGLITIPISLDVKGAFDTAW